MFHFKQTIAWIFFLPFFFSGIFLPAEVNNVHVVFSELRSAEGFIQFGIYRNEEEFKKDAPFRRIRVKKSGVRNGVFVHALHLPDGTYGLSGIDDENSNAKLDYNFVGMPKEGFCFSNYYHSGWSYPKFKDFVFVVKGGKVMLNCRFRYV